MPASAKTLAPATRSARGREIRHLADHRRLEALGGADQVDRFFQETLRALSSDQDQGATATAVGHEAILQ
jgi:hypothetical protein